MENTEFQKQQQIAIEKMREMNSRSGMYIRNQRVAANNAVKTGYPRQAKNPVPSACQTPEKSKTCTEEKSKSCTEEKAGHGQSQEQPGTGKKTGFPFSLLPDMGSFSLSDLLKSSDAALIIGLLLILYSEDADKKLLFALIYILL